MICLGQGSSSPSTAFLAIRCVYRLLSVSVWRSRKLLVIVTRKAERWFTNADPQRGSAKTLIRNIHRRPFGRNCLEGQKKEQQDSCFLSWRDIHDSTPREPGAKQSGGHFVFGMSVRISIYKATSKTRLRCSMSSLQKHFQLNWPERKSVKNLCRMSLDLINSR